MPDQDPPQESATQTTEPDWKAIRESYLQGKPAEEITETFGVSMTALRTQITRQGWAEVRAQSRAFVRQELSDRIKNSLIISILRDSVTFERFQMPPPETTEHEIASRNRARLIESAAKLLGWSEEPQDALAGAKQAKVLDV